MCYYLVIKEKKAQRNVLAVYVVRNIVYIAYLLE